MELNPEDQVNLMTWAEAEIDWRNFHNAYELYEMAKSKDFVFRNDNYYRYGLAKWGAKKDTVGALEEFQKVTDSAFFNVYRSRFELLFGVPKYRTINNQDIIHLMKLLANPSILYAALSYNKLLSGDIELAKSSIEKAITLDPRKPIYYLMQGILKKAEGQNDKLVLVEYSKAIIRDRNFAPAYLMKSFFYREIGNDKEACKNLKHAEKLGTKVPNDIIEYICYNKSLSSAKESALKYVIFPYIKDGVMGGNVPEMLMSH